ncbi:hypothetical protein ACIBF1_04335 [Spirillospora sp. NPDC050679]
MASPTPPGAPRRSRPVVYVHVGAAKSGTTYVQNILWLNRDRLRRAGVLYPGRDVAAHVRAAFDLRRAFFPGASDPLIPGSWPELLAEVRDWPGTSIISQELFAPAGPGQIERALADLDFAEVHVVFTVRDLARQIPAHWQEDVKNRFTTDFADFVAQIKRPDWRDHRIARLFWGLQDPVAVLERWGAALPPERVHVVTLPRPGAPRDLLWRRFCAATGLDPEVCDPSASFGNPSLGLAETQFLLRLNQALDERVGWHVYNEEVKHFLAQDTLTRRPDPEKITLPAEELPWTVEWAARTVAELRAASYTVHGDLAELVPEAPAGGRAAERHPDDPRWPEMADVGMETIATLLERLRSREARSADVPGAGLSRDERVDALEQDLAALLERTDRLVHEAAPLPRRTVRQVTERYPETTRLLRAAYRRVQAKVNDK